MPSVRNSKKVRPISASGLLQSQTVSHVLEEIRPTTAPNIKSTTTSGFDPTFLTSRHHVPGTLTSSSIKGRQVHGGVPKFDLKTTRGRRASLSDLNTEKLKRPLTAASQKFRVKVSCKVKSIWK